MIINKFYSQATSITTPSAKRAEARIVKRHSEQKAKFGARSLKQLKRPSRGASPLNASLLEKQKLATKGVRKSNSIQSAVAVNAATLKKLRNELSQVKRDRDNYSKAVGQLQSDASQAIQERDYYQNKLNHIQANLERTARRRSYADLSSRYNLL